MRANLIQYRIAVKGLFSLRWHIRCIWLPAVLPCSKKAQHCHGPAIGSNTEKTVLSY